MRIQTKPGRASTLREGFPIILKEEGVGGRLATCVSMSEFLLVLDSWRDSVCVVTWSWRDLIEIEIALRLICAHIQVIYYSYLHMKSGKVCPRGSRGTSSAVLTRQQRPSH